MKSSLLKSISTIQICMSREGGQISRCDWSNSPMRVVKFAVALNGIDEDNAKSMALNAIIGSCELALTSDKNLDELIDSVCSPGGSTIAGLNALKEKGFIEAVNSCYEACVNRSKELKKAK